jgi:hypothetical protein
MAKINIVIDSDIEDSLAPVFNLGKEGTMAEVASLGISLIAIAGVQNCNIAVTFPDGEIHKRSYRPDARQ